MNDIAVVILAYNNLSLLKQFLPSVIENSAGATICVIDNGSKDATTTWLPEAFPDVQLIALTENLGFAGGYNAGIAFVKEPFLVLLNSDVEVSKGWLPPLIATLKDSAVAAVQPKILSQRDPSHFEYAGAAGGFMDILGYPYCQGRVLSTVEKDDLQYNHQTEIFWATGACMAVKKSLFEAVHGFDESFFAHMEEIDLCWRWKRAGYKILYTPDSTVYHVGAATLKDSSPFKVFLNFRNSLAFTVKNRSYWAFFIFCRLLLDGVAALVYLGQGKPSLLLAVLKAHFSFYYRLPSIIARKKRESLQISQLSIGAPNLIGLTRKLLLLEYYCKGNKTYKSIHH